MSPSTDKSSTPRLERFTPQEWRSRKMALFPDGKTSCLPSTTSGKEVELWYPYDLHDRHHWQALESVNLCRSLVSINETKPELPTINDWHVFHRAGPNVWTQKVFVDFGCAWAYIGGLVDYGYRYTVWLTPPEGPSIQIRMRHE